MYTPYSGELQAEKYGERVFMEDGIGTGGAGDAAGMAAAGTAIIDLGFG